MRGMLFVTASLESVRSKGDDDEEDDGNAAFCRAAPAFGPCRHPPHHRVNERFPSLLNEGGSI